MPAFLRFAAGFRGLSLVACSALLLACGGDEAVTGETGPGSGGKAGAAGKAGPGGASGKAGQGGSAGNGGASGAGAKAGAGGGSGAGAGGAGVGAGGAGATSNKGGAGGQGNAAGISGGGGSAGWGGASGSGGENVGGTAGSAGSGGSAGLAGSGGAQAGGQSGAAGSAGIAGSAGAGGEPAELAIDRSGVRLRGPIVGLSLIGRELWIGTNALPDLYDATKYRAGLHRLSLDDGAVTTFEKELPTESYAFPDEAPLLGPVATAGVAAAGQKRLAISPKGLVVVDEKLFVTSKTVTVDGAIAAPTHVVTDEARKVAWLSTNRGLATLDLDTLAVKGFLSAQSLGGAELGSLALDAVTGAVYIVVYDKDFQGSRVVRVLGNDRQTLVPGTGGVPTGLAFDVVWSPSRAKLYVALQSFKADSGGVVEWDGASAKPLALEGDLANAVNGEPGPFGAHTLALDETDGILAVGGRIAQTTPLGPLTGGGLVFVRLGEVRLQGALPGEQVAALAVDEITRRFYVSSLFPCSEVKLRNRGLVALSFDHDGKVRTERPILSGVRDLAAGGDGIVVGIRDDKPGFACNGYPIQTGLYALRSNGSGELLPLASKAEDVTISPDAGPVVLDVSSEGKFALGTFGDANFFGVPGSGLVVAPTEHGTSNYTHAIAFAGPNTVWVGGIATHTPSDPPKPNIGPRGAARYTLNPDGSFGTSTRFTRASDDPTDIVGLPSGDVRGTLVASDGSTYVICARERLSENLSDRDEGTTYILDGKNYPGGIARISGDSIAVVTDSGQTPDPRAAAFAPDGRLVVADAKVGLVALSGLPGKVTVTLLEGNDFVPTGAIPTSVWAGAGTDVVVTFDKGIYRNLGGEKSFSVREGYSWRVKKIGAAIFVGHEDGLTVLRPGGAAGPKVPAIEKGELPGFAMPLQ